VSAADVCDRCTKLSQLPASSQQNYMLLR